MKITKYETCESKNIYLKVSKQKHKRFKPSIEFEVINLYPNITYQKFYGIGGAITEAAAYNYSLLSEDKKKQFIKDYFGNINYSLCRLTIGSCDFSLSYYNYTNTKDLSDFDMSRDEKYIIPFIKDALEVNPNLKFLASPWSPPKFMKNNKRSILGGKLAKKYRQIYSNFLVKYIKTYEEHGIKIDYITIQNETSARQLWESCIYTAKDEATFLSDYLYPTFKNNGITTKILVHDHNKDNIFNRACSIFENSNAEQAASGIAFHWYTGSHFENIALCRAKFPNMLLFHTEGCCGYSNNHTEDAYQYAIDMIEDFNNGTNAYIDWNILLNSKGGPHHVINPCNSPVMLNNDSTDYIKNLPYYYIGHFSKLIKPGAVRIAYSKYTQNIHMTAFKNTDNSIAVVILNANTYDINYRVCFDKTTFKDTIAGKSMISYLIK